MSHCILYVFDTCLIHVGRPHPFSQSTVYDTSEYGENEIWNTELPIDFMTEEHQSLIAEHCSKYDNPKMPDLPTSEESEEESSVSEDESVEGASESEASDDDDEDYIETSAKKRRKY